MALTNMVVYNQEIAGTTIELLGQKIADFVAASGGAFIIDTSGFEGDFSSQSFFNQIAGAMADVDRYASNVARSPTALTQSEMGGVKVAGGFTALFEPAQMTYLMKTPDQAIMAISEGFANALLAKFINQGLAACVAAVGNIPALVNDVSAGSGGAGALTQTALNGGHGKFGDMAGMLTTDFMSGAAHTKLIEKGLANGEQLFVAGNVTVTSILGKLIVVTDAPALTDTSGTPDVFNVLSLSSGGIIVDNTSDIVTNIDTTNGNQRIETTWQADFTYGVNLKGYKWDETNGGASPTSAELATGSNWDIAVGDTKHSAGTLTIADLAQ